MPSSLVTAFRQQFPRGSILAEVLTIHDGLFVVRVSVLVEGTPLSQALAANNSLELAEDIACNRALERLTLPEKSVVPEAQGRPNANSLTPVAQVPLETFPRPVTDHPTITSPPSNDDFKDPETFAPATALPPDSTFAAAITSQPSLNGTNQPPPPPEVTPPPVLKLAPPPNSNGSEAADQPASPHLSRLEDEADPALLTDELKDDPDPALGSMSVNPIDLSDIIAQTDVELQRLGWDVNQGREFLEKNYGKRSRHDLTDEELLQFLLYLESQPLPSA